MNDPELIGYANRFSVSPGQTQSFMVSSDIASADAQLVRLKHGDTRSPIGLVEEEVKSELAGPWQLERQTAITGSFGVIDLAAQKLGPTNGTASFCGHVLVCPTRAERPGAQPILSQASRPDRAGWELHLEAGSLALTLGDAPDACVRLYGAMQSGIWYSVSFAVEEGRLAVWCTPLRGLAAGRTREAYSSDGATPRLALEGQILLAGADLQRTGLEPRAARTFDGKLERPVLAVGAMNDRKASALAGGADPGAVFGAAVRLDLDLGRGPSDWDLHDRTTWVPVGQLYNAPTRWVTGHLWAGETVNPAQDPASYAAVHFHSDDIHTANWSPTRTWTVPANLRSGVYALRLRSTDGRLEDRIPFLVSPSRIRRSGAEVALWLPSFTYAAYANAHECMRGERYGDFIPEQPPGDRLLERHPEWGNALYNVHADGTGVTMSSLARPIPNLRPDHRVGLLNAPRHLAADLYLVHWLEHVDVPFDVFGDEDVHRDGAELLRRYRVVLTGSHPEYVSSQQLDGLEQYLDGGGRLMYMGGNGFYWATSLEPGDPTTVEVRRAHQGTRTWDAVPGETHHQLTGEPGGLWRHRGRGPHQTVGVGFVSEGWDGHNRPYYAAPNHDQPQIAWAFEGIDTSQPIGDTGLVMNGAAGDEIDSVNHKLGSSPDAIILASATNHSDAYWLAVEDVTFTRAGLSGSRNDLIRADATVTPRRNGGAVFAASSISWIGSLSASDYNNPLAGMTENILRAFIAPETPWLP